MGDLFSSKQKTTTTQKTQVPSNFQNLMNRTIQFANEGLDTPFESYNAPRIAELSQNEQAGIASAGANAGMYQDLINMAGMNNAAMQLQGGVPTQGDLDQFMNPYVDYVLGNTLGRLNEASDRNMTNIGGIAGMAGAFGGSRHGVLEGANLAELLKSTQEASANSYSDAFDKGMGNWFNSQNLRRGTISDALNIAQGGQNYNNNDINALMSTGLTERTRNQGVLDFAYSEFMREQQDPFTKAGFAGSVMQQYPTNLFTRTGVSETTNTPSPISQIAGIGMAAAGLMTGNPATMAGLGAGARSLGAGGAGAFAGTGSMGSVGQSGGMLPYVQPTGIAGSNYSGVMPRYAEGGKVDPIGELIRQIEAEEKGQKRKRLSDLPQYKYGRQSTNVEDRRGASGPMSEDARRAANIPMGPTSFWRDLMAEADSPGSDNWLGRFLKGDDPEAQYYMALKLGNDPDSTYDAVGAAKQSAKAAYDKRYGSKYAKGGRVPNKHKYFLGGLLALDYNQKGDPESRQAELEERQLMELGMMGRGRDKMNLQMQSTPRQPFNWEEFIQRQGLNSFMTPQFPNSATPRLPAQGPQLGQFVQALQSKLNPSAVQGTPRGVSPNMPGYKEGGTVISGNKKTRAGSRLWEDAKVAHDGSPEDITYLLDEIPDEEWTQTEGSFDGTHQPVQVDRKDALRIALQKHETGAKDYENPNYFANTFKGKENSHAFGLGQWQPSSWNAMATSYNRKNKDKVRFMTQDDVKADRLPTKEEQNKIWGLWEKQILRDGKGDYAKAFAAHQLGGGDLSKVLNAPIGAKMKDVVGEQIAKNVSAKNETVGDYFNRLNKYIGEGEGYLKNKLATRGGNMTDVLAGYPMDQNAMGAERAHNFGPVSEDKLREIMRKRGDSVFTGVQPDGRQSRVRKGSDLGEVLSPLETVMGGRLPIPPDEDYLKQMIPGLVEKQELEAPSRFVKGGIRPFSGGGYVKGYASGKLIQMPDGSYRNEDGTEASNETLAQQRYREAINASRKGVGMGPLPEGKWGAEYGDASREAGQAADAADQEITDILSAPWTRKSRVGQFGEGVSRTLGSLVPLSASVVGRGVQGGASALDFLFGDQTQEGKPNSIKAPAKRGPFGDLNMSPPNYGQGENTGAAAFNDALESGEPSEIVEAPAKQELQKGDVLNNALQEMIMGEIEARKTREERDPSKLFGMNVNMPLIKMGLGILANSGYPNSAGEAIGKGVLGALEGEENTALKKQERDSGKLKELVNLRYMQAMVESMDPNIKMQLQKEKAAQEFAAQKFKSDYEFQQWLSKQNYSEEMQMRLIKFRADIAAQQNNPFGDIGKGRTDLTGGE